MRKAAFSELFCTRALDLAGSVNDSSGLLLIIMVETLRCLRGRILLICSCKHIVVIVEFHMSFSQNEVELTDKEQ